MKTQFKKVGEFNNYCYWIGKDSNGKTVYNIAPKGQTVSGGYFDKNYILKIKNLPDLFGEN